MSDESFQIGAMNHVGIAVPSVTKAAEHYRTVFGVEDISDMIVLPEQGVKVIFVNAPTGQIELIEPFDDTSPITKFLERNPLGGQHHICFEVDDIYQAQDEMKARGVRVLNEPRLGAHGTLIIFLHPKDMGGVLIELMEKHQH